ncbi:hypothetical protein [Clostridium oryzae]|uniref:Actin-like protein N-terminal domain-containing protein n=1 Tax=Clostridium oryzae TaxID=1450648 RepID=A0A1V4ILI4_9CLOT|nr:hypothetical protein [Clostridium oryzae]OPJ60680.1 hypothetical protein CLORY_27310 [Clostridium oryzae]
MSVILSIDSGKFLTKAIGLNTSDAASEKVTEGKRESFRSKIYYLENGDIDLAGKSYLISYEGQEVIIGEQGVLDGSEETNKATLLHKLCIYAAITRYIKPEGKEDVYLVLACPLNLLKSPEYKEEYKSFIANDNNEVNILVNGKDYKFTIKDITIKAEGSGILYLNKERFNDCEIGLIDIGGLNMQFCKYINGVAQPESRFTEMTGSNKLVQDLKEEINVSGISKSDLEDD